MTDSREKSSPPAALMAASRIVAGDVERTFDRVLPMPIETIFVRWQGPLPPVRSTEGPVPWQQPGQQRRVNLVGPGWMIETLTEVERPHQFSYRLGQIHGPMRALIATVEGRWAFRATAGGTEITWSWAVTPRAPLRWLLPVFTRFWRGYAEQALRSLDRQLRETAD